MDQRRDAMSLAGSAPYYVQTGAAESVNKLQNSPNMSPLSNAALHFQSNTGGSLPLDSSSTMSGHGVNVGPHAMQQQAEPVRRKRGRPRKYGHDGAASLGLSPPSMSTNPSSTAGAAQKWRGRPSGSGRKQQPSSLGGSVISGGGTMTPHIINVPAGEDIKRMILSLLQGRRGIIVLSGIGSISAANIRISSSSGSVTYEGHYDMVNLSGSYINDVDDPLRPTGGLNVTFNASDGSLIGGPVEGVLIAASPVQVIVGSMLGFTPKLKRPATEDLEASGNPDRATFGDLVAQANVQTSQNLNAMGGWSSSR